MADRVQLFADALFTTTQQRLLALLYGQPSRSFYASKLIALTGSGSGAVQRELKRLSGSGLVTVTRIGRQKHYQANPGCPVFAELRGLVVKTVAVNDQVRQALEAITLEDLCGEENRQVPEHLPMLKRTAGTRPASGREERDTWPW